MSDTIYAHRRGREPLVWKPSHRFTICRSPWCNSRRFLDSLYCCVCLSETGNLFTWTGAWLPYAFKMKHPKIETNFEDQLVALMLKAGTPPEDVQRDTLASLIAENWEIDYSQRTINTKGLVPHWVNVQRLTAMFPEFFMWAITQLEKIRRRLAHEVKLFEHDFKVTVAHIEVPMSWKAFHYKQYFGVPSNYGAGPHLILSSAPAYGRFRKVILEHP